LNEQQFIKPLLILLSLNVCLTTYSQPGTGILSTPANSCQSYFDSNSISIHYSYADSTQTHNYSNNWDFDGDGKTDNLYFIGTGGAHLYFYLRIVLSSDKKIRNFPFIQLDMPCLGIIGDLVKSNFYPPPSFPQFVVDKFISNSSGDDANDKMYIYLDNSSAMPAEWKKSGVSSHYLLLRYRKGEITIKNFIE
jgi:hypothetical protein